MRIKIVKLVLMLLGSIVMGCSSFGEDNEVTELVKEGDRVPSFSVNVKDGERQTTFSTDSLTGETIIMLFNTSCSDCQRELPVMNRYYLEHKDEAGFQMVAISREEDEQSVATYWREHELRIPYSAQTDRTIYNLFASSIIPRIYFCNAKGIVTKIYIEKIPK